MGLFFSKPKQNLFKILGLNIGPELESRLTESLKNEEFTDFTIPFYDKIGLFEMATLRFFGHKQDLSGKSSFNLILENKNQVIAVEKVKDFVNQISAAYGKDSNGNGVWTIKDDQNIQVYWEGRTWYIDKNFNSFSEYKDGCANINLFFHLDDGIEFSVLSAHQLL